MSTDREGFEGAAYSGKLWSLWDMLEIKGAPFLKAVESLASARAMVKHDAVSSAGLLSKASREIGAKYVRAIAKAAGALGAKNTRREAKFICDRLDDVDVGNKEFGSLLDGLSRSLTGEIASSKLFALETQKARYYNLASAVFGPEVLWSFPGVEYDLEEASKSLATARNTACVFHLMRAMEAIVAGMGNHLKVTVIDKNDKTLEWAKILANIGGAIEGMDKGESRTRWSNAHSLLYHVKEAWRNPTMHPTEKYTDEEARQILEAVIAFIRNLTTLVDPFADLARK